MGKKISRENFVNPKMDPLIPPNPLTVSYPLKFKKKFHTKNSHQQEKLLPAGKVSNI